MNTTTPTSCWGESRSYRVVCICAARHSKTLNSQLEAELSTFVQGNPCLMPLSRLLWVFLAFTFSGRDAPKHGCGVQGERTAHRHVVLHWDLGRKGRLEKRKCFMSSVWFVNIWVQNFSNFYSVLFTISALFSYFFPQYLVWPRKLLKTSQS